MLTIKSNKLTRALLLGNMLEFYDVTIYAFFHSVFAESFFRPLSAYYGGLYSWLCFALAYFARPIGSLYLGYIGDKTTRSKALLYSILGMALSTLFIGILPVYQTWGLLSPILLVIFRFMQGFSMGGECNGVAVYLTEIFPQKKQVIGSLVIASTFCGALLAIGVILLLSLIKTTFPLWRICFILGGSVGFVSFYLRRSHVIQYMPYENTGIFKQLAKHHKKEFLTTLFLAGLNGSIGYILLGFLHSYLKSKFSLSFNAALLLTALGIISAILASITPACQYKQIDINHMMDKVTRSCLSSVILCGISLYLLQNNSLVMLVMGCITLGSAVGILGQYLHAYVSSLFPPSCRYTGTSFAFSIGMAVFGGTAPTVYAFISQATSSMLCFLIYPLILMLITFSVQLGGVCEKVP